VPDREVDLSDNFEMELPVIKTSSIVDKVELIREIEEDAKKYIPDFKLNPQVKELLGILRYSELSNLSDEELKSMYHESVWKGSDEKYSN